MHASTRAASCCVLVLLNILDGHLSLPGLRSHTPPTRTVHSTVDSRLEADLLPGRMTR